MKEFIHDLYSNENFAIYLGAIILVLLVAFFVVFFLGKKDKEKLEKTRKLEALNENAFKEVTEPVAVETVKEEKEPVLESAKKLEIEEPAIKDEIHVVNDIQPVITPPVIENVTNIEEPLNVETKNDIPVVPFSISEAVEALKEEPKEPQYVIPNLIELPVNNEDNFTYTEANNNYQDLTNSIENDLHEMEEKVSTPVLNEVVEPPISLPEVEVVKEPAIEQPEEKKTTVMSDVFSSVYAPKKDPVMFDDTVEIELPRLK